MKKIIGHEFAVVEELIASRVFSRLEYILPQRLPQLICICDRTLFLSSRGNLRNILVPSSRKVAVEHEQCKGILTVFEKAKRVFDEMPRERILPSVATYNAMIQVLCKKDNVENAILVFEEMLRKGYVPNSITYNLVVRGLCHAGHTDRAVQFTSRMEEDGCEPNVQTYNIIIRYFCDAGEIENGMHLSEKMGSRVCLPNWDTDNILASSMFVRKKSDNLVLAGKLLLEMVDRGFVPRKLTFNRVLDGLLLTGNQGFVKEILRVQSKSGRLPLLIHTEPADEIHPLFSARVSANQILHNISVSSKHPGDRFCYCKLLQM